MKNKLWLSIGTIILISFGLYTNFRNHRKYIDDTQVVWKFVTNETITSSPTIRYPHVYARTLDSVYAIDLISGTQIWKIESKSKFPLSLQPVNYDDYLIVPEEDSRIAVFATDDGTLLWRSPEIDPPFTHPGAVDIEAIIVGNDVLYVARFDWKLTAYSLESGNVLWEFDLSGRDNPYLALDDGIIFVGSGSRIVALDGEDGSLLWNYDIDGYIGPLALEDNLLYILDQRNSKIIALDTKSLLPIWTRRLGVEPYEFNCISVESESVYVSSERLISVSKINGEVLWESNYTDRLECPSVWKDKIIVRNTLTNLFILNRFSGKELERFFVSLNTTSKHSPDRSPTVDGDMLFIPISDNDLIAVDLQNFANVILPSK